MKTIIIAATAVLALPALALAQVQSAQSPQQTTAAPPAQKSLSQGWGLYVFPAKQQTKETQDKDEYDCYTRAKGSTGTDPLAPAQAAPAQPAPQQQGGAVKGAAQGAADGAALRAPPGD